MQQLALFGVGYTSGQSTEGHGALHGAGGGLRILGQAGSQGQSEVPAFRDLAEMLQGRAKGAVDSPSGTPLVSPEQANRLNGLLNALHELLQKGNLSAQQGQSTSTSLPQQGQGISALSRDVSELAELSPEQLTTELTALLDQLKSFQAQLETLSASPQLDAFQQELVALLDEEFSTANAAPPALDTIVKNLTETVERALDVTREMPAQAPALAPLVEALQTQITQAAKASDPHNTGNAVDSSSLLVGVDMSAMAREIQRASQNMNGEAVAKQAVPGTNWVLSGQAGESLNPQTLQSLVQSGTSVDTSATTSANAVANGSSSQNTFNQYLNQMTIQSNQASVESASTIERMMLGAESDPAADVPDELMTRLNDTTSRAAELQSRAGAVTDKVATTSIPTNVNDPQWTDKMGERVMWMAGRGIQSAQIHLNPAELGPVDVKVSVQNEQTVISFNVQNNAVKDLLESNIQRLRDMLEQNGVDQTEVDVQSDTAQQQFAGQDHDGGDGNATGGNSGQDDSDAGEGLTVVQGSSPVSSINLVDDYV